MANKKPKYRFWKSETDGLWYFHLRGANGKVQQPSEGYASKKKCVEGIERARRNATIAIIEEIKDPNP